MRDDDSCIPDSKVALMGHGHVIGDGTIAYGILNARIMRLILPNILQC
jgi:hypothetical protein